MEPRLRSRGSRRGRGVPGAGDLTFNGAAAAKPRKPAVLVRDPLRCVPSMEPRLRSRGSSATGMHPPARRDAFNGAAAAKPRKPNTETGQWDPIRPSMEPRLRSRGSVEVDADHEYESVLQWSRGCEAAEARLTELRWDLARLPSMEPRLRSRGSPRHRAGVAGRTCPFNGAAAAKPRKLVGGLPSLAGGYTGLQWSRGCEAAEAPARMSGRAKRRSFNGAAAAKPRKRRRRDDTLGRRAPSMEPRLRSRGSPTSNLDPTIHNGPSMEPRLRSRGSPTLRVRVRLVPPSMEPRLRSRGSVATTTIRLLSPVPAFNGAAAAKPRKPIAVRPARSGRAPSMEPRLRSRGSSSRARPVGSRRRSFNGAAAAKPRKLVAQVAIRGWRRGPSMEPRLRSRGSARAGASWSIGLAGLQWSRGCEAAEAFESANAYA